MKQSELKEFLDEKAEFYNQRSFIESDPIQIPHLFSKKEDIEIAGFLTATIAWGNRKSIIKNAERMMQLMDHCPFDFVQNHSADDLKKMESFVHRTFNGQDFSYFVSALKYIYQNHQGLEQLFALNASKNSLQPAIHEFKKIFFTSPHLPRTEKHVSDPLKNSAAKRINMYLRWMVRHDDCGVDFGIWKNIKPNQLFIPLDVHVDRVARKFRLLTRKQTDWLATRELTDQLKQYDPDDPVKYDFALFGMGVLRQEHIFP